MVASGVLPLGDGTLNHSRIHGDCARDERGILGVLEASLADFRQEANEALTDRSDFPFRERSLNGC